MGAERVFCSVARVAWNPRSFKLRETTGSKSSARRNSVCAGRSSALKRRRFSSISVQNLKQPVLDEPVQQFAQVVAQQLWLDIIFR